MKKIKPIYFILLPVSIIVLIYVVYFIRYLFTREFEYFSFSEFDSSDEIGSGKKHMNRQFIQKLDRIRAKVGIPFIVNSGYRTPAHNQAVGGAANSAHLRGHAVDISAPIESFKVAIAKAAIAEGITRIGWGSNYIHLDDDPTLPQNVVWNYGNSQPYTFDQLKNLA